MKIKIIDKTYEQVMAIKPPKHKKPKKPSLLFRRLIKFAGSADIKQTNVKYNKTGMDKLQKDEPCLILMNHSAFIDLEIAADCFYPRPLSIVCTTDGFIGKEWLMRRLGCIPTRKFIPDAVLLKDIEYALKTLKCSVLMYPEAGYSFDGRATTLPGTLGRFVKSLNVPVVSVITHGAFLRDPLYNCLQKRAVDITVDVDYFLSPDDIADSTTAEIQERIQKVFDFDNFAYQKQHQIAITEDFRADGLERILYKCPRCQKEGYMLGCKTEISCSHCNTSYTLDEYGELKAKDGATEFLSVTDWFAWEREQVLEEIKNGTYCFETSVEIYMQMDYKALYRIGFGTLTHNKDGFHLAGCEGKLDYWRSPITSYCLNADFFWYEIGDMISVGDANHLFYCIPENTKATVTKPRMATELMYILKRNGRK